MGVLRDRLDAAEPGLVWLDHTDYTAGQLADGAIPWLDVAAYIELQRRAQTLLKSDVIALALAPACAAWLDAHAPLRAAMGTKRRAIAPLKTLLADQSLRWYLMELADFLSTGLADSPLALVLPSPRRWMSLAYAQAYAGEALIAHGEDAESASMYVADFLRNFGLCGVDVLLLEEAVEFVPRAVEDVAEYQSVLNVAANFRWDTVLRIAGTPGEVATAAFDLVIAPSAQATVRSGAEVPDDFWSGAAPPPGGRLRYAVIPARARPETVLERLALLR